MIFSSGASASLEKRSTGRFGAVSVVLLFLTALVAPTTCASSIGVCWGRVSNQPMSPTLTVSMLQANKIQSVKLFDADSRALTALAGTGIEVMVMVSNQEIQGIATSSVKAQQWIDTNISPFVPADINIKYISIGNEPFLTTPAPYDPYLSQAVDNMYKALVSSGLNEIVKLTVSFNSEILGKSSPPSAGAFNPTYLDQIVNISRVIYNSKSVFSVNIYPFYNLKPSTDGSSLQKNVVFFEGGGELTTDTGNGLVYANVFDASLDALFAAFKAAGIPQNISLIIGEIGWPSDGSSVASTSLAQEFNQGAIHHFLSGVGTPLKPGLIIPGYLFSLFDEDNKGILPGPFERYWGIYDVFGTPKYALDLSGQNIANVALAPVPDVHLLPKQWCVVKSGADPAILNATLNQICGGDAATGVANCLPVTSNLTTPGLQCGSPTTVQSRASYAFNAYYQSSAQNASACDWNGVAEITKTNSSYGGCKYELGLDLVTMNQFTLSKGKFSVWVLVYIIGLVLLLPNFL